LAARGQTEQSRKLLEQSVSRLSALKFDAKLLGAPGHLQAARKALAAFLLEQGAYFEAAAMSEDLIRDRSANDNSDIEMTVASNLLECSDLALRDEKKPVEYRHTTAVSYAKRAFATYKSAATHENNNAATINLAWFCLVCPVVELRHTREALKLAQELTQRSPARADSWTIWGAAAYHCGDHQHALKPLQRARELDGQSFGFWDFFVAMAEWQLGHQNEARVTYDRAQGWIKKKPPSKMHQLVYAQATTLLKLPTPTTKIAGTRPPQSAQTRVQPSPRP
jgi:tetratricopeptide (TPR) repeat protein